MYLDLFASHGFVPTSDQWSEKWTRVIPINWKHIKLETPCFVTPTFTNAIICVYQSWKREKIEKYFRLGDLDLLTMALTFGLDLGISRLHPHAKNKVHTSIPLARARHTGIHTHTDTQKYYTIHWIWCRLMRCVKVMKQFSSEIIFEKTAKEW